MSHMKWWQAEHQRILEEMDDIDALFAKDDPRTLEDVLHTLEGFTARVAQHEAREEAQLFAPFLMEHPGLASLQETVRFRREHKEIFTCLKSLRECLESLRNMPFNYWRRKMDRGTIQAQVDQVFNYVREHIAREERELADLSTAEKRLLR